MNRAVAVAVAACGFVAGVFPIFESDLFWHLAAGRWMLDQGAIPRADPFRFTSDGAPWVDHEWLFQLAARGVEAAAGLDGLIVLRAAALGGFAALLWVAGRRAGLGAGPAGLVALGATLGVRPRFLVRPEIVTLFGIVLLLHLLEGIFPFSSERRQDLQRRGAGSGVGPAGVAGDGATIVRDGRLRRVAAIVGLVVVWVNFHGEAMLAPVLAGLSGVGAALAAPPRARRSRATLWPVLWVPAMLAVALLANPYGWRLIEVPLGIARAMRDLPAANPEWLSALAAPQPYLFGGLAVVAALAVAARSRTGHWPAPEWGLPALALAALSLSAVRHQALFYAAAAPFAAHCLAGLAGSASAGSPSPRAERRLGVAVIGAAMLIGLWCAAPPASGPLRQRHGGLRWGLGLAPGRFPVRAAELLARYPELGPLYNDFAHGGYLLWRLHPPRQVYLDGRMELDPELLHATAAARRSAESWSSLLEREGAAGALVRYDERQVPVLEPGAGGVLRQVDARTANALLFPPERWQLADWDDETLLFLRPDAAGWHGEPYRNVEPEEPQRMLERAAADPVYRAAALADVERKLAGQPDCRRAQRLLEDLRRLHVQDELQRLP